MPFNLPGAPSLTAVVLAVGLLAACQPLPQPFSRDGAPDNALLALPDHVGVIVLPVAEAPPVTADALAAAMVEALHAANVPAATRGGNRASRYLQGRVEDDGRDAGLVWELFAPDGSPLGEFRHSIEGTPVAAWRAAEPALMHDLAWTGAAPVAALLQPRPIEQVMPLTVADTLVTGAPGRGNLQLRRAMLTALEARGVLIGAPGPQNRVQAAVDLAPASGRTQRIRIAWRVLAPDGTELGTVAQQNEVPAGSLDDSWDAVAPLIAVAAAPGILEVLSQNRQSVGPLATKQP